MATFTATHESQCLRALVDMGSNGIRFSISNMQPSTVRIIPTVYQHRAGISLYDAQYSETGEKVPINNETISAILSSFEYFKATCKDFGVLHSNITVLATEATRTALNSEDFRKQIKDRVGWEVKMLSKEEEGLIGAMGVASSVPDISGLVMDLGGGSMQLSWLMNKNGPEGTRVWDSATFSMPYGAAAMTRRLAEAEKSGSVAQLRNEVLATMKNAYDSLEVPAALQAEAQKNGGLCLYLSGGGFRGWGYILMSQHQIRPYPISVINGFKVGRRQFLNTHQVKVSAAAALDDSNEGSIFRVSDRRASQVPAVAFLVNVLAEVLPELSEIRFCQGGVREGFFFSSISPDIQAQHPLEVATRPFDVKSSSNALAQIIQAAIPDVSAIKETFDYSATFTPKTMRAFASMIYYHSGHSKDLQAVSALRCTTSGVLAGVHGLLHESRALLALLLCARWNGPLAPNDEAFKQQLERLMDSPWTLWWIKYIAAVAAAVADVYPAGIAQDARRLRFKATWNADDKARQVIELSIVISSAVDARAFEEAARNIEKIGKRKRWVGGKNGTGFKVRVNVSKM